MITLIDYGVGNTKAFLNVYKQLNIPVSMAKTAAEIESASKLILPGVGSFDHAMDRLNHSGMREALDKAVLIKKIPVLGICVGMQMLAASSSEGKLPGLGWLNGEVKKFDVSKMNQLTHLPHMGWNDVLPVVKHPLFDELYPEAQFYFLHSFYFHSNIQENVLAISDYGGNFTCAVGADNIFGVQFHPEKSHQNGIQLLKNFANLTNA
jgi:glutamine amidotransferase